MSEGVEAWIWTPEDGAYLLGEMRDGLGWVSEDNVCRSAEANLERIYFLKWNGGGVATDPPFPLRCDHPDYREEWRP